MSGFLFNKLEIRWFRPFRFLRPSFFPYLKDGFDGVFFVVQKTIYREVDFDMRWNRGTIFSNWVS
jgi:hypothetical protein